MTERTILILGDSPFLAKVHEKVRPLLDRYYSIGINNIITKYYTNEHIFVDKPFTALTNNYVGKTVSPKAYDALIHKENKYLVDMFSFSFEKHTEKDICIGNRVAWCGFTHDYAISYCIQQGFKRIILVGAADFTSGPHFSTPYTFKYSKYCKEKSKKFIEDYVSKVVTIETCNPDSYLCIPRVSINDLLK